MLPYLPSSDRHQTILVRRNWLFDLNQGHNQFSLRRFCFNLYDYLWSPTGGNRWPVPLHWLIKLYVLTHIEIQVFFFHNSVKVFDRTWDVERLFLTEQVRRMRRVKVTKKKGKRKNEINLEENETKAPSPFSFCCCCCCSGWKNLVFLPLKNIVSIIQVSFYCPAFHTKPGGTCCTVTRLDFNSHHYIDDY